MVQEPGREASHRESRTGRPGFARDPRPTVLDRILIGDAARHAARSGGPEDRRIMALEPLGSFDVRRFLIPTLRGVGALATRLAHDADHRPRRRWDAVFALAGGAARFLFLGFPLIAVETMLSLALVLALTARRAAHLVRSAPSFVAGAPGRTIAWLGQPAQARVRLWGKVALGLLALLGLAAYEMR